MIILFGRMILLSQLLSVDTFGTYAFASSWIRLSAVVPSFGMGAAFLHRSLETADEETAAAVHFTLKLLFTIVWAAVLLGGAFLFTSGSLQTAFIWLTLVLGGMELTQTPRLVLTRRVTHQRLAVLQIANTLATTVVALVLAWQGAELLALLMTDLVALILALLTFYGWRAVWRPRLCWAPATVRYYLSFGYRSMFAEALLQTLNRADDLWTGYYFGERALGFYSRAYTFATYPRQLLASPINAVAGGTYAELKEETHRLSQAFFRTNAFLIRSGFLLAGLLALIAPEFIRLALGEKWLPMLTAFRLMMIFTLLDPIKVTVANLYMAVGKPEAVVRVRLIQLIILLAALYLLRSYWGISGVALAVDLMLVGGISLLLWQARKHVKFSVKTLFFAPTLALGLGLIAAWAGMSISLTESSDWIRAGVKTASFSATYLVILLILERERVSQLVTLARKLR